MELKDAVARAEAIEDVKRLLEQGAFLCSAYGILKPDERVSGWTLSFYSPQTGNITPVDVSEGGCVVGEAGKPVREKTFTPFRGMPKVDVEEALQKARTKAGELKIRPDKIIVSLQKDDLEYWSITFLAGGGEALNVRIDAQSGEVLVAEKSNLLLKNR